jgi:hypothetical protein
VHDQSAPTRKLSNSPNREIIGFIILINWHYPLAFLHKGEFIMANENKAGQKQPANTPKAAGADKPPETTAATSAEERKNRGGIKGNKTRVGGTAVPGAKSMQPKQVSNTNNPQQQQAESYNRTMRRRMEQMGMSPTADNRAQTLQEQRKKRIARKKQRLEERRQEIRKTMPRGGIRLGREILYPVIGGVALIILLIVVFLLLRH